MLATYRDHLQIMVIRIFVTTLHSPNQTIFVELLLNLKRPEILFSGTNIRKQNSRPNQQLRYDWLQAYHKVYRLQRAC